MKKNPPGGLATSALIGSFVALAALTTASYAAPIAVNNHSFENLKMDPGGWNNELPDPTVDDPDSPDWIGQAGANNPNLFLEHIPGFNSEGVNHMGVAGGYYAFQNTGVPYEADTLYTLTVGVGYRNSNQSGAESLTVIGLTVSSDPPSADAFLDGFDTNEQLDIDSLLASNAVTVDSVELNEAKNHTFSDVVLEFATDDEPPSGNIVIFLGDDVGGARSHFDNVRLESTSNIDPDGDGIPTEWETGTDRGVARGLDPEVDDGDEDPDGDSLTNFEEWIRKTHPQLADTDGDGLNDGQELTTDPLNPDSDGDTLTDGAEVTTHMTDPNKADSDGDQFEDQAEVASGTDPNLAASIPVDEGDVLLGVNFIGGTIDTAGSSVAGIAGAVAQGGWNNVAGAVGLPTSLTDVGDEPSILRVKWSTNGTGLIGAQPGDDEFNAELMHGVLLPRGSGAGGDDIITQINVLNIAYPSFDLYLYVSSGNAGEATFTANDETIDAIVDTFDGEFVQIVEDFDTGNYILFEGLTGPTLTVTGNANAGAPGIAGFQIVRSTTDTDGDGMPDVWEEANGLDPEVDDAAQDKDGDGSTNLAEYNAGTNPQDADTDKDGLADGVETNTGTFVDANDTGTNPRAADTDKDGLNDKVETNTGIFVSATDTGSDPNNADTDNDGASDGFEVAEGSNPVDASSVPPFPTPIGYWSFDDGAQETADLAGTNPGSVNGGATFVEGHSGNAGDLAIQFDGVDASVTTEASLGNLDAFTMSGWAKFDVDQTARTGLYGQNDVIEFGMINATTIEFWMPSAGALQVPFGPATDGWTHIAVVSDDVERSIYINGENVASGGTAVPTADPPDFFFNIGGDGIQDAAGNFFEGEIDDVAIWDRALKEDQIKQLADGSVSPLGTAPGSAAVFQITSLSMDPETRTVSLTFPTIVGRSYAGEFSDNLVDWLEFEDLTADDSESVLQQSSVPADVPARYYRVTQSE